MRVAIDARKLHDGGIGTYIRGLLGTLSSQYGGDEWTALVAPADAGSVRWAGAVHEVPVAATKYGIAEHFVVPNAARAVRAELLHAPHYTLPWAWRGPAVVTIHDLIHVRFARFFKPGAGLYARWAAGLAARRAARVIADSEATKRDVVELLRIPAGKVRVVPLGVSPEFRRESPDAVAQFLSERALPWDYVLYVGARKRHKNLELLLRAWCTMRPGQRPPLVFSGRRWEAGDPHARLARDLRIESGIWFAGDLAGERELALLYSGAMLLVQPSLAEGFGLPPLEAMACGTPVLASDAGSLPEVLGDAAVFLAPRQPTAWAHTVLELAGDRERRQQLAEPGIARAATFTWKRTAAETREIYGEVLAGQP